MNRNTIVNKQVCDKVNFLKKDADVVLSVVSLAQTHLHSATAQKQTGGEELFQDVPFLFQLI